MYCNFLSTYVQPFCKMLKKYGLEGCLFGIGLGDAVHTAN
jgi:hypothetical protein